MICNLVHPKGGDFDCSTLPNSGNLAAVPQKCQNSSELPAPTYQGKNIDRCLVFLSIGYLFVVGIWEKQKANIVSPVWKAANEGHSQSIVRYFQWIKTKKAREKLLIWR